MGCTGDEETWGCSHAGPVEPGTELPAVQVRFAIGLGAYPRSDVVVEVDNSSDEFLGNNSGVAHFEVTGIPDLSVDVDKSEAITGETFAGQFTIRNRGTVDVDRTDRRARQPVLDRAGTAVRVG